MNESLFKWKTFGGGSGGRGGGSTGRKPDRKRTRRGEGGRTSMERGLGGELEPSRQISLITRGGDSKPADVFSPSGLQKC